MKVFLFFIFSCTQFVPIKKSETEQVKEIPEVVAEEPESDEKENATINIEKQEFESSEVDLVFLGSGIKSIGISKVINELENRRIKIGKVSGESFGLLISEVYKLKESSNYMDWIFFKYFKDINPIEFVNNFFMNQKISSLAESEFDNETSEKIKKQNGLLLMARDFSLQDCEQRWYQTTNKIWCLLSGEKNKIYDLKDLNMTVFELKAGLLNKDSLVDILELGKIFFRTHTKENE